MKIAAWRGSNLEWGNMTRKKEVGLPTYLESMGVGTKEGCICG